MTRLFGFSNTWGYSPSTIIGEVFTTLLRWPALSFIIMEYTTVSLGQPGCGGAKHFFESMAVIITISPLISSNFPFGSTSALAKVAMQLSRLSIKKTLKRERLRQVLSPFFKAQISQLSSPPALTPISPSPSVNDMVMVSV